MPTIDLDQSTYDAIDLAARITGMSHSQVIARLVQQSKPVPSPRLTASAADDQSIGIYADYEGHRTAAIFHQLTKRIDITGGPLAGHSFKSPSSAARAVVAHYKPEVSPHRNGWTFWTVGDGSGRILQSIRTE
jgi:hypothetical protein